jgi:hypothetical protein
MEGNFYIWCESDELTSLSRVVNFSLGGLFVEAAYQLLRGSKLMVSHQDQTAGLLATPAEVIWYRPRTPQYGPGMGLHFVNRREGALLFDALDRQTRYNGIWSFY